jgi:hypothetical protein
MILMTRKTIKDRVGITKILMLVKRVKVGLGGDVITKQKITHLCPTILQMFVMSFPQKGLLKKLPLSDAQLLKAGWKMI